MKILKGTVHWYDNQSCEGMIKDEFGNSYYINSNEMNLKPNLNAGQPVNFKIIEDTTFAQVSQILS